MINSIFVLRRLESSSPHTEKMQSTYTCDAGAQVKSLTSRASREGRQTSGMSAFKGISTLWEWPQLTLQQTCMSSWEDTHCQHHLCAFLFFFSF